MIQKPIISYRYGYNVASVFAEGDWFFNTAKYMWALVLALYSTSPQLLFLVVCFIFFDFVTGVIKSKRNGVKITSHGIRDSFVKVIEYAITILVFQGLANSFELLNWVDDFAYALIALTEAFSVYENITDSKLRKVWSTVIEKVKQTYNLPTDENK